MAEGSDANKPRTAPALTPATERARAEQQARLARALRENLRRRKAQQRGRETRGSARKDPATEA